MADDDLVSVEVRSGVSERGDPFCTVVAETSTRQLLLGQLPPDTVRQMALDFLGAAEAAETDAIVFRLLRRVGLEDAAIGRFVADMRDERG
jgi:hypothetical protein